MGLDRVIIVDRGSIPCACRHLENNINILFIFKIFYKEKPTENAYSSGHLVLSHLGLAFVLMLRQFIPELVMTF